MTAPMSDIRLAAERLRGGGVVAFPTETVYGLGADALNPGAVGLVFRLKGRPTFNPLIVHVSDESMARQVTTAWPAEAQRLASAFWPGPLTIVLPRASDIPDVVTGGGPTVGVRCPDHPVAIALIETLGRPIVGPSANRSGGVSPTTADHVRGAFSDADVMVLDGGPCRAGIESSVVSLVGPSPALLRKGVVTREMLEHALGRRVDMPGADGAVRGGDPVGPLPAPGMLRSHYAPKATLVLFESREWPDVLGRGATVVVLSDVAGRIVEPPARLIPMPQDSTGYAARLYAAMREADALNPELIAVEMPAGSGGVWDAIRDRLGRAAAER